MTVLEMIHQLVLGPIELLLDVIFALSMKMTDSPVLSIVALSLAINLLVLPLYRKADAMQQEEREITLRMKPMTDQIRETFTGDERFMLLQTYYRQNNYKPYYVLRGSLSLLLQIPFFMAAYNFLSGLGILQGVSFGPIADLSLPDRILHIGGVSVNLLPVLMTLINIVSGMLYTRGMPLKSKIQLYGMALIFLALLYNSPSGLVFYWTLNNVFSLCKNLVEKLPNPGKVLRTGCSLLGAAAAVFFALRIRQTLPVRTAAGFGLALALQLPALLHLYRKKRSGSGKQQSAPGNTGKGVFFSCCILLTILTGLLIPSAVIHASPAEFVEFSAFRSPLELVLRAFLTAAGTFLIWSTVFYLLAAEPKKKLFSCAFAVLAFAAVADYMFFGNGYGNMSSLFVYDRGLSGDAAALQKLLNLGVLAVLAGAVFFAWKKKEAVVRTAAVLACLATAGMSAVNIAAVAAEVPEIQRLASQQNTSGEKIIRLDRNGKNVIVFMLDRAIGYFPQFIFREKPEMLEQYEGFVCYQNTLSYGGHTNTASPALFGGYEYTPEKINSRTDVLLKDEQNEALKVLPLLFLENGYDVTVCDPPYANYQWIPDLSIYDEYPGIRTFITEGNMDGEDGAGAAARETARERNLFCYSIFRISPLAVQPVLYDDGNYNRTGAASDEDSLLLPTATECYAVLEDLPQITYIREEGQNTFLMIANGTTHDPMFFQEPEYELRGDTDNTQYDLEHPYRESADGRITELTTDLQRMHYQTNAAALMRIGEWLDYLRDQGVYDNTRIILVSDHGHDLGFPETQAEETGVDMLLYNPLLMVKDFDCRDGLVFSSEFMTNADTPVLALSGLVTDPVNPFTGQAVTNLEKEADIQTVCESNGEISENHGTAFVNPQYYTVRNHEVLNPANWGEAE